MACFDITDIFHKDFLSGAEEICQHRAKCVQIKHKSTFLRNDRGVNTYSDCGVGGKSDVKSGGVNPRLRRSFSSKYDCSDAIME